MNVELSGVKKVEEKLKPEVLNLNGDMLDLGELLR